MILDPGDSQARKNNVSGLRTQEENKSKCQFIATLERESCDLRASDARAPVIAPRMRNGIGQKEVEEWRRKS